MLRRACVVAAALAAQSVLVSVAAASPRGETEAGNDLFRQGKFSEARARYLAAQADAPDAPQLDLNIGAAFYNEGHLEEALKAFSAVATKPGADAKLLGSAAYDAGNALFKSGLLDEAVEAYKRALRLDPNDVDAKHNLELAIQKREEQKKEQQEQDDSPGGEGQESDHKDEKKDSRDENSEQRQDDRQKGDQQEQNPSQNGESADTSGEKKENENGEQEERSQEERGEKDEPSNPAQEEERDGAPQGDDTKPASAGASASPAGAISKDDALRFLEALEAREMQAAQERNEEALLKRLLDAGQDW